MNGIKKCVEANTDVLRYRVIQALQHKDKLIKELENTKRLLETENKLALDTIGRLLEEKETMKKEYEVQLRAYQEEKLSYTLEERVKELNVEQDVLHTESDGDPQVLESIKTSRSNQENASAEVKLGNNEITANGEGYFCCSECNFLANGRFI